MLNITEDKPSILKNNNVSEIKNLLTNDFPLTNSFIFSLLFHQ